VPLREGRSKFTGGTCIRASVVPPPMVWHSVAYGTSETRYRGTALNVQQCPDISWGNSGFEVSAILPESFGNFQNLLVREHCKISGKFPKSKYLLF